MNGNGNIFEVRLKVHNDIISRHFKAGTAKQAAHRAKKKGGKILSVKKVHPSDVIGSIESMNLKDIIGKRRHDVIQDDATIDSIVYSNKERRFRNARRRQKSNTGQRGN